MSVINAVAQLLGFGTDGYQISRSVRLRSSASAYFNRTPASAGNRKTWTWSGWIKRGGLTTYTKGKLFGAGTTGGTNTAMVFGFGDNDGDGDWLLFQDSQWGTSNNAVIRSSALYRDASAWYHIVLAVDTTQATGTDRVKIFVNGLQISTTFVVTPSLNVDMRCNTASMSHYVGSSPGASVQNYFDGYLTEINFIDGQALTPSSFGETNTTTGVWQPKKYTGTYGTNGFYLNFSDNSSNTATTIGKDNSGNGNNWTPNNISVTAGATYDSMLDVPTPYADGGNGRGNYATLNPLLTGGIGTPLNGNLTSSATDAKNQSSFPMQTGKWYAEIALATLASQDVTVGITSAIGSVSDVTSGYGWGVRLGRKWVNGSATTGFSTAVNGDIAGLAFDADAGQLDVYKNNVLVFSITGIPTGVIYNFVNGAGGTSGANTLNYNFGQRPFTYTPPTGFKALNTQNLPDATITNGATQFAATTYTGTGSTRNVDNTVNGKSFQPDLVWLKIRSSADSNGLFDSVRGAAKRLQSNDSGIEATTTAVQSAFLSNGFTVGTDVQSNGSGSTYVAWQWKAGGTAVSNTAGSITSQVSANASAGFSVVTYTGTGANATVGHGLGVAPKMVIVKTRSVGTYDWCVYHANLTSASYYIPLNGTAAQTLSTNVWNATAPTSTVFSIGTSVATNQSSQTVVAYCFSEVAGYSKFGSYTGNGSADGPFVYCGFRPRYILWKSSTSAGTSWTVLDTSRDQYNLASNYLLPNSSGAEAASGLIDILSNGFKVRATSTGTNVSGETIIFAAFAETSFKFSLGR